MSIRDGGVIEPNSFGMIKDTSVKDISDNIHEFIRPKHVEFPKEKELYERMLVILNEYCGELSPAAMIGTLEMIKDDVMLAMSDD